MSPLQEGQRQGKHFVKPTRPLGNQLLDRATGSTRDAIRPHLNVRRLSRGEVLFEPGDMLQYVRFPLSGVVSLCSTTRDGGSVGVAAVGPEGLVGASIVLGFRVALCRAIVHVEGHAACLQVAPFADAMRTYPDLHAAISEFTRWCSKWFSRRPAAGFTRQNSDWHVGCWRPWTAPENRRFHQPTSCWR